MTKKENKTLRKVHLDKEAYSVESKSLAAEMDNQTKYEASLYFVKQMHQAGLINDQDFETAERFLYEKYKPLIRH